MVADILANDLSGQVRVRFVGVHNEILKAVFGSIWEALEQIEIP
jgi:hypothetical protein